MKRIFILSILLFISVFQFSYAQEKTYTIMIDPGHGGHDPGNIGNGYREKNIVLKVSMAVGAELAKDKNIKVHYTRKKDVFVDLWKRGEMANDVNADLFISIHCNAHSSSANGTESFVLGLGGNKKNFEVAKRENAVIKLEKNYKERYKGFDPDSPESILGLSLMQEENLDKSLALAASIQKNFRTILNRKDRGVKQQRFVVLYQTYMPSVLVELGFLTNKNEGRYLNSKSGQQKLAKALAAAIKKYVNQLRLNTVKVDDLPIDDVKVEEEEVVAVEKNVIFKIQIASSKKRIRTKSYNFKGLKDVERVKVGRYYKYYYGITSSYEKVKASLQLAKKKGYTSAFIAAFKDGEKVSLKEALK